MSKENADRLADMKAICVNGNDRKHGRVAHYCGSAVSIDEAEKIARVILSALRRSDCTSHISGTASHLNRVTIDGKFNLVAVAFEIIRTLKRTGQ